MELRVGVRAEDTHRGGGVEGEFGIGEAVPGLLGGGFYRSSDAHLNYRIKVEGVPRLMLVIK